MIKNYLNLLNFQHSLQFSDKGSADVTLTHLIPKLAIVFLGVHYEPLSTIVKELTDVIKNYLNLLNFQHSLQFSDKGSADVTLTHLIPKLAIVFLGVHYEPLNNNLP